MAAAGLADIGARDLQPLVLGRGGQHPLQQLAVAGLELGLRPQLAPCSADPSCQRIADRLQVAEIQRPRLTRDRRNSGIDLQAREGVGKE